MNIAKSGVWTVITASGEIDLHHSTDLRVEAIRHLDAGEDVLLHMAGVGYLDSSGIAALAQSLAHARKLERKLALAEPSEAVTRILRLTRLDSVFITYPSVAAAPDA